MNGHDDRLTRGLAPSRSRRPVLKALLGSVVSGLVAIFRDERMSAQTLSCSQFCANFPPGPSRGDAFDSAVGAEADQLPIVKAIRRAFAFKSTEMSFAAHYHVPSVALGHVFVRQRLVRIRDNCRIPIPATASVLRSWSHVVKRVCPSVSLAEPAIRIRASAIAPRYAIRRRRQTPQVATANAQQSPA